MNRERHNVEAVRSRDEQRPAEERTIGESCWVAAPALASSSSNSSIKCIFWAAKPAQLSTPVPAWWPVLSSPQTKRGAFPQMG